MNPNDLQSILDAMPPRPPVDYLTPLPDVGQRGAVLNTLENLAEILDRLGYVVRYNEVKKDVELDTGDSFSTDNRAAAAVALLLSECARFSMPTGNVLDYLTALGERNRYSPIRDWVLGVPWDGAPRLADLCATITSSDTALKDALIKRWMISAVAAAFSEHGLAAQGVLVLQGVQGLGKTSWLRSLVPAHLDAVIDGVTLNPSDKDSVKTCVSYWLVELGEIDATFRKSDLAQLKQFITKSQDEIRLPYAKAASRFARRTVFFGSVNDDSFLNDRTGNRRFWTVQATAINFAHGLNMQQVWAEVYALYEAGEQWHLTEDEFDALAEINEDHVAESSLEEKIRSRYDWSPSTPRTLKCVTDVLDELGEHTQSISAKTSAGMLLAKLSGTARQKGCRVRYYEVPAIKTRW